MAEHRICYVESRRVFWARHLLHRLVKRLKRQGRFPVHPRLVAFPNDLIGRELAVAGAYEPDGIRAMQWLCDSGIVAAPESHAFLDIGANIGIYTTAMAGRFAEALAFEPHPVTARVLALNVEINGLRNVKVQRVALSDRDGEAELFDAGHDNVGASSLEHAAQDGAPLPSHRVPLLQGEAAVRAATARRVGLIKLDVEGHELKVIEGLSGLLAEHMPVLAFESNDPALAVSVPARLRTLGYESFVVLDFWPVVGWLPLRVLLLTLLGVRHALRPVESLEGGAYSLVFALPPAAAARWRELSGR